MHRYYSHIPISIQKKETNEHQKVSKNISFLWKASVVYVVDNYTF